LAVVLAAVAGASVAPAGAAAQSGAGFPVLGKDKWLGSINELTRPLFTQYFDQVTPENAGKYPNIKWIQVVNEPLHDPPDCTHSANQGNNCNASGN
jgi:hypothetical protein